MTGLSEEKQITRPSEIDRFSASTPIHGDPTSRGPYVGFLAREARINCCHIHKKGAGAVQERHIITVVAVDGRFRRDAADLTKSI
jgi:hypothetical protein